MVEGLPRRIGGLPRRIEGFPEEVAGVLWKVSIISTNGSL
jgi:hypothetical protein